MKKQTKNTLKVLSSLALVSAIGLNTVKTADAKSYKPEVRYDNGDYFVKTSDPSATGKHLSFLVEQNDKTYPYTIYEIVDNYKNQEVNASKILKNNPNFNISDKTKISIHDDEIKMPDAEGYKNFEEENYLKIEDINFYPVGYPGFMIDEALKKLSKKLNSDEKNIVIVHTGISAGENTLPGLVSTSILDLFKDKAIYVAGGHIHSFSTYPKEKPFFFVPGSLEFSNVQNEKSDRKGFILFDTDSLEHEFIELEHRKRVQKNFIYNDSTNIEAEFEAFVKELNLTGEEILVISIGIKNSEYINLENLENIAENNGALKTHILIKNILSIGNSEEGTSDLSIEELEKNLISDWNISNIEKFSASFSELKELFSNGDKDSFLELFDKTLEVNEDDN